MTEVNKRKMLVEKRAMRFSFLGSAAFVAAELISFFWTGAHTILMDCIFDGMDLILIGPFMVLIPFLCAALSLGLGVYVFKKNQDKTSE